MRGNIKNIFVLIPFFLVSTTMQGISENDSIVNKPNVNLPSISFFEKIYTNPGAAFELPTLDQGHVEARYLYETRDNFHLLHEGSLGKGLNINAKGSTLKNKSVFWGKASYTSSQKQNVSWTNVSDALRLGPYLIADSIGGDFYGEEYSLSGGFSSYFGKLIGGLEAGYRGGSEYRKHDPRPKTIVSDLYAKIGISYPLSIYKIGASLSGGIYKQNLNISVEEDHITYRFFLMKGFGQTDFLESTTTGDYILDYKGSSYGVSIFLLPTTDNGFIGDLNYHSESIDSYTGSNKYPSTFSTTNYHIVGGYKISKDKRKTWLKGEIEHQTGKGTERIYKSQGSLLDVILVGEHSKYTRNISSYNLSVLQQWETVKTNKWIETCFGNDIYEERYASPVYKIRYSHLNINFKAGAEFIMKQRKSILAEGGIIYRPLIKKETGLPLDNQLFNLSMLPDLQIWEASSYGAHMKFLYEFPLKNQVRLYAIAQGTVLLAQKNMNRQSVLLTVGFRY